MLQAKPTSQAEGRQPPVEPNMTPMIDVVFLLIIFFLVSSHLAQRETRLELALPTAETGLDDYESTTPRLTINILSDGQTLLGMQEIDTDQLKTALLEKRNSMGEQLQIRLRGDRSTNYGQVEPLLVICAEAGISDVRLAVFDQLSEGS